MTDLRKAAEVVSAVKVERPLPDYRLVRKNGTLTLQRAYCWACGTNGGVDWRDEPTIDLDQPPTELRRFIKDFTL